jgi:sugar transferase (PEP-CTERM/EpsH1 system associated)
MNAASAPLIVHVVHRLAVGGLENGVVNLINHLPAERFRHAIVCMTATTDFAKRIRRTDVPIVALDKQPGRLLLMQRRLYRAFRDLAPTVVHTRNLGTLEAQLAATLARIPVRIHGEHGWDTADPHGRNRRYALIRRAHAPFVHRYVALSSHIERYLREQVGIGASRIERICNGVDCDRFVPAYEHRSSFPYAPFRDERFVLFGTVGRLEPVKDQLTLARAFAAALARDPSARERMRLAIVGEGSLRPAIERVIAEANARDLVWLAGERSDVAQLLAAFDAFVLPSLTEGISNTILEAMACGVPVIATSVGGNVELVVEGETGALVAPADPDALAAAMLEIASSSETRVRLGVAARARALREFSLAEMVRRYTSLYEREIARRASRAHAGSTRAHGTVID